MKTKLLVLVERVQKFEKDLSKSLHQFPILGRDLGEDLAGVLTGAAVVVACGRFKTLPAVTGLPIVGWCVASETLEFA